MSNLGPATLPVHCVHCGCAGTLHFEVEPGEAPLSVPQRWKCPACAEQNQGWFLGRLTAVTRRRAKATPPPSAAVLDATPHDCNRGWICEQHQDRPWLHDACTENGVPCPICDPAA